eukprot:6211921-Pleurochrysis_carterae.AAC.1
MMRTCIPVPGKGCDCVHLRALLYVRRCTQACGLTSASKKARAKSRMPASRITRLTCSCTHERAFVTKCSCVLIAMPKSTYEPIDAARSCCRAPAG